MTVFRKNKIITARSRNSERSSKNLREYRLFRSKFARQHVHSSDSHKKLSKAFHSTLNRLASRNDHCFTALLLADVSTKTKSLLIMQTKPKPMTLLATNNLFSIVRNIQQNYLLCCCDFPPTELAEMNQ